MTALQVFVYLPTKIHLIWTKAVYDVNLNLGSSCPQPPESTEIKSYKLLENMKYKHSRNYIAKLIDERMTGFCGMSSVDSTTKQVLNLVCGDLIPLLYATKPTKVKKIKKLSLTTPYWLITENGGVEEIDKTKVFTDKVNELIDAVNSLQNK